MPAYSFKERFIPMLKDGTKRQTIRGKRKQQAKSGDTIYLYYGMRTKWCTKIGEGVCTGVSEIEIRGNIFRKPDKLGVWVNGRLLKKNEEEALANADGFPDFETMGRWWKQYNVLPFIGDIIYWKPKLS